MIARPTQESNWTELAYTHLHAAALISQCLQAMKARNLTTVDVSAIPAGAAAFGSISTNLVEESAALVVRPPHRLCHVDAHSHSLPDARWHRGNVRSRLL